MVDPGRPLHYIWHYRYITLWSRVLPTKFGRLAILSNLTFAWTRLTLHKFWPQQCFTFWSGVLPTKFGSHIAFLSKFWPCLAPTHLCMTFDLMNALRFGHGFFLPNLVAIGHFLSNLTSGWPLTFVGVALKVYPQTFLGAGASPTPMPVSGRYFKTRTAEHTYVQTEYYFRTII